MEFVFDPGVVHECAMTGLGRPKPAMFEAFADALAKEYPGRLDLDQPWIFSNAGGAMIQMKLYYASVSEYIMIWGTPIGSEGHSGRHAVGFWDTVLDGEMWYYGEGQFEKRVYRPGDRVYVGPNQARGMNFTTGVWAVEYARGVLPLSVPFGLADGLVSTLDFATVAQTVTMYAALVGHAWQQPMVDGSPPSRLRQSVGSVLARTGNRLTRRLRPPEPNDEIPSGTSPGSAPTPAARTAVEAATATPHPPQDDSNGQV
ncbi:MAG: ERG2 family protein [Labedaea sp.]